MDLTLTRTDFTPDGIFGKIAGDGFKAYTVEHAYEAPDGSAYVPKIPTGTYTCVRGQHRLDHMTEDFTTFEVTNVPGHAGILFHWGNWNKDSDGCILLGSSRVSNMVTHSVDTFHNFMALQDGVDQFTLVVI